MRFFFLSLSLSIIVRDVVIVGEPNPAVQLHTTQLSDGQAAAVQMEAASGGSTYLVMFVLNNDLDVLAAKWQLLLPQTSTCSDAFINLNS